MKVRFRLISRRLSQALCASIGLLVSLVVSLPELAPFSPNTPASAILPGASAGVLFSAVAATPEVVDIQAISVSADGRTLQLQSSGPLGAPKVLPYTVMKLPNPSRMIIDFPNARLNPRLTERVIPLRKNGLIEAIVSENRGTLYSSVRMTLYVDGSDTLNKLKAAYDDRNLVLTLNDSPQKITEAAASPANKPPSLPNTATAETTAAPPNAVVEATTREDKRQRIKDIYYRDGRLTIAGLPGSELFVKRQFGLEKPSRLVIDIQNAVLVNKDLLAPINPGRPEASQIRVGQFDEDTVRIVMDTQSPLGFHAVYPEKDRATLVLQHASLSKGDETFATVPNTAVAGLIKTIAVAPHDNKGVSRILVESNVPIAHRLQHYGRRIVVDLSNLANPAGDVQYDVSRFPQFASVRVESNPAGRPGSRLIIDLKSPVELDTQSINNHRGLELSLMPQENPWQDDDDPNEAAGTSIVIGNSHHRSTSGRKAPYAARVVVDAGHGGKDNGATRAGVMEKELNLQVALRLKKALEARGLKVYLTRSSDVFLPLPEITAITNRIQPDLFVSVHHNASTNSSIYGIETYYYTSRSLPLANRVHKQMVRTVGAPDRGTRRAMFYVIHHTNVPAILCEVGYVSNPNEREDLTTGQRQQNTAEAIADGVVDYLRSSTTAQAPSDMTNIAEP